MSRQNHWQHRLRTLALVPALLLALPAPPLHADTPPLPEIGNSADTALTPAEGKRIGSDALRSMRQNGKLLDDRVVTDYVSSLGYRLIASSSQDASDYTFFVVNDSAINAFAMPGGFIGINTGLIAATRNESELAAVLAHEIGHVAQHHLARSLERSNKMKLPLTAALIAAMILGSSSSSLGQAAMATSQAAASQMQLTFSREYEREADRTGMRILAEAGFDPHGMPNFFDRLQQETRYYSDSLPEFLRTHPVTAARIADSRNRADQYPPAHAKDSVAYQIARARVQVETADNAHALTQRLATDLKSGRYDNGGAERYAYAIALTRDGRYDAARKELQSLLTGSRRIAYFSALAENETTAGNLKAALSAYREGLGLYPDNGLLSVGYAETLLHLGRARQARDFLRETPADHLGADYHRLMAQAETALGHRGAAHLEQAEYHYASGEIDAAIEQLQLARKSGDLDFYDASRVDARLEQLKQENAKKK